MVFSGLGTGGGPRSRFPKFDVDAGGSGNNLRWL